jgi:hypothetical protein
MYNNLKEWKTGSDGVLYFGLDDALSKGYSSIDLKDVCLQSRTHEGSVAGRDPIVIGYRALQAMVVVGLEVSSPYRIHLAAHKSPSDFCTASIPKCKGQLSYDAASNTCLQPDCSTYMFSEYDSNEGSCILKGFIPYAVYAVIIILIMGELVAYQIRRKAVLLAQEACERNLDD